MSRLLKVSQLQGDVCPACGAINKSKITQSRVSTRISNRTHADTQGLIKRFHVCDECGYTGRDNPDNISFNTIAVREDELQRLLVLANTFLTLHQKTSEKLILLNLSQCLNS